MKDRFDLRTIMAAQDDLQILLDSLFNQSQKWLLANHKDRFISFNMKKNREMGGKGKNLAPLGPGFEHLVDLRFESKIDTDLFKGILLLSEHRKGLLTDLN